MKLTELKNLDGCLVDFKSLSEWEKKVQEEYPDALIRKFQDDVRIWYYARTKEEWAKYNGKPTWEVANGKRLADFFILKKGNRIQQSHLWTKNFVEPEIKPSTASNVVRLNPFKPGDRVRLKPMGKHKEEFGEVVGYDEVIPKEHRSKITDHYSDTILVLVDQKYRTKHDDGIREVMIDDVEREK